MRAVTRFAGTLAILGVLAASAQAQDKPNFSGTWKLDPSQSQMGGGAGGRPGGGGAGGGAGRQGGGMAAQEMTIAQEGNILRITMTVMGEPRTLTYAIGGGPSTNAATMGRMSGEAVTTTVWDGNALVTSGTTNVTTQQGAMSIQTREVRTISHDLRTMTVEITRTTPMGENTTKMVYTKG